MQEKENESIQIHLMGNRTQVIESPCSVSHFVKQYLPNLQKTMVAAEVDGKLVDLSYLIQKDAKIAILDAYHPKALEVLRHSSAHLLAQAVKCLYPQAQVAIGPVIENGFYYDFYYPEGFSEDDLLKIEKKMQSLAKAKQCVSRKVMTRYEAQMLFKARKEMYKVKMLDRIPENETISLYEQGDFIDLCRGPHVPDTGKLTAFKLTKLAGAYWLGDSSQPMLQRIYGTAWPDKKSLKLYLYRLEEAKRRDHRKLAVKMDLFHLQPESAGMVFWHANGWILYQNIKRYIRNYYQTSGYQEVSTPQLIHRSLLERSGHWNKFGEGGIFTTTSEKHDYAIRPMNCPCHVEVYKKKVTSYRDLPLRLAEFGGCFRNEPSGTLHGLMRLRSFVQDDGHIFCTHDQIADEVSRFITQLQKVYKNFGFEDMLIKLATRPENAIGDQDSWEQAEKKLKEVLNNSGLAWDISEGEGAFYGPKIEFSLKDSLDRVWQCGTIQLDFYIPDRLDAHYIDQYGNKATPVMLHRAILGSLERFIGVLLEHTAGCLPFWLAPVQILVMNVSQLQKDYVQTVVSLLQNESFRVKSDLRNEKISYKIRESSIARVPYTLIIGDKEKQEQTVTVRKQSGENLGTMTLMKFKKHLNDL